MREAIFGATFRNKTKMRLTPADTVDFRWCVSSGWKLIVPRDSEKEPELYDLTADPHEKNNLAKTHPARVQRLRKRIDAWWSPRKQAKLP